MTAKLKLACLAGALVAAASTTAFAGARVDAIKARGELICGVNTALGGFSIADSTGKWVGLDADVCRAVAAALSRSETSRPASRAPCPASPPRSP